MDERLECVAEILESWAEGKLLPPMPYEGICYNLRRQFPAYPSDIMGLVPSAVRSWTEFSGDVRYPVPHEHVSPESAYTATFDIPKWGDDAYGQARRRLCQHVADWVRANSEDVAEFLWRYSNHAQLRRSLPRACPRR